MGNISSKDPVSKNFYGVASGTNLAVESEDTTSIQLSEEEVRILEVMDARIKAYLCNMEKAPKNRTPEERAQVRREKRRTRRMQKLLKEDMDQDARQGGATDEEMGETLREAMELSSVGSDVMSDDMLSADTGESSGNSSTTPSH